MIFLQNRENDSKVHIKTQIHTITGAILRNKSGGLTLPNFNYITKLR